MESRSEKRVVIKFLVGEGEKASKVLERLQTVYGEHCLLKSQVYEWYQRFRDGRTSISDDEHPGHPVSVSDDETVAFVEHLVLEDRRITIEHLSSITAISVGSVHAILHWYQRWLSSCHPAQEVEDEEGLCTLGAQASPASRGVATFQLLGGTTK